MKKKFSSKRMGLLAALLFVILLVVIFVDKPKTYYQGYVEGNNLYIASPFEGNLVHKYVSRGQFVKKGQLLFQIDPQPEALLVDQLKAGVVESQHNLNDMKQPRRPLEIKGLEDQVKQIDASLALGHLRLKRFHELYKKQAIDLDHVDETEASVKRLEAERDQAIANLELSKLGARTEQISAQQAKFFQAQAALKVEQWKAEQKILKAPADGFIFDTYYQEGEFIPATRPIAALLPLDQLHIEFFVPARELPRLSLNQTVWFQCEACKKNSSAILDYISPEAEYIPPLVYSRDNSDKIVFRVRARIEQPKLFKTGQPVLITGFEHAK